MKKRLSFLLALWMVIFSIGGTYVAADETAADNGEDISLIVEGKEDEDKTDAAGTETDADEEVEEIDKDDLPTYDKYIEKHASASGASKDIVIAGGDFTKDKGDCSYTYAWLSFKYGCNYGGCKKAQPDGFRGCMSGSRRFI